MGHRGKEQQVICEKCGRSVRRDKAVFIEKAVFSNPLDRKDVAEPSVYRRSFVREVAYCPGCGKHLRIYEKKKAQLDRQRDWHSFNERRFGEGKPRPRPEEIYGGSERKQTSENKADYTQSAGENAGSAGNAGNTV